jgi:anti-sigma regulatory factor (Ser/Thr protein kinase)
MYGVHRELALPAVPASAAVARRAVRELAERTNLSTCETYEVMLAVSEAVANAIEHGSPDGGVVQLSLAATSHAITVEVQDSGHFPAPTRPDDGGDERGRGLPIIGMLSDRVELRPGPDGTTLRFAKSLSQAA